MPAKRRAVRLRDSEYEGEGRPGSEEQDGSDCSLYVKLHATVYT